MQNPRPKDTWREGEHYHCFLKIIIHETKEEPNKKGSNLTILSKKTPRRPQQTDERTKHAT